ncbi:MAG: cold shock domain-containing protein [Planctomycetota bacterium]
MQIDGEVKWFDARKGYGFILGPEGQDVFVHFSEIKTDGFRTLRDGEQVQYELVESAKGYQAKDVQRSEAEEEPGRSRVRALRGATA